MKIARFWEKSEASVRLPSGESVIGSAWGWSPSNREEALQNAEASAQRVAQWLKTKTRQDHDYGLDYPDRPPREEIVREIKNTFGQTTALITRNATGALILSTPRLVFIDVDIPPDPPFGPLARGLKKLFRQAIEEPEQRIRQQIAQTAARHPEYSFRLYRTAAGFRCVLRNTSLVPDSAQSRALLEEFGADELYRKLCHTQECYRARLTPKFWRCGVRRPPNRFPWDNAVEEEIYRQWQREYEAQSASFAVCRFVEQFGMQRGDAELQSLLELHDKMTGVESDLELA